MRRFENKVANIAGASSGIGKATAIALAKEGAKVVISGRNEEGLAATARECKEAGAEVLEIACDVSKFENLAPLIKKTVEKFSSIDILINNAGLGNVCPIEDLPLETYESLFDMNLRAPIFLCKYALPHLKKTKGCVVNVSSRTSMVSFPANVPYSMTKRALDQFTRGFAAETAQFGVRANTVNPALVATRFGETSGSNKEIIKVSYQKALEAQKLGIISSETVAEGILFLCSSTHITGTSLLIDGGAMLSD